MMKIILVVIVSLFAALIFTGVGVGIGAVATVSLECSNQSTTSYEYTKCMDNKAAQYGKY